MRRKTQNWSEQVPSYSIQEQNMLRQLKENQNLLKITNWQIIAEAINQKFGKQKTSKQCRLRYINHSRFDLNNEISLNWTK